jgi:serine protease Do
MRHTSFLAIAAVSATAHSASAQTRVRISEPSIARAYSIDREPEHRAALGLGTSTTGTLRDTLGLMITSITRGSPAEKAGLEEGNRLAAINGVSLKVNAADVEDGEMSTAFTRRLTRELAKSKPGDEVELKVYRDGRTQTIKVKTADSDILFPTTTSFNRTTRAELENRAALGIGLGSTGSRRDSLGVLVMSVSDSSPAAKAGIEEGNRIAAINGINLRVAREDAGDRYLGGTKAQRLQREIGALKPGDNVTLKVYSNGQFRDVTVKAVRAGDLPRSGGSMFMYDGGPGDFPMMPAMPMMPSTPMTPMAPMSPMPDWGRFELIAPMARLREMDMPELRRSLDGVRDQLRTIRPQLENLRPQIERSLQSLPRVRGYNVIV